METNGLHSGFLFFKWKHSLRKNKTFQIIVNFTQCLFFQKVKSKNLFDIWKQRTAQRSCAILPRCAALCAALISILRCGSYLLPWFITTFNSRFFRACVFEVNQQKLVDIFFYADWWENVYIFMDGTLWAIPGDLWRHPHRTPTMLSHAHFLGQGRFFQNRPHGGQKSILTKVVQIAQGPQNRSQGVPRSPIDPHLSWFGRGKLLGEYKFSNIFGDFGFFEEFPNMAWPPPSIWVSHIIDMRNRTMALARPIIAGKVVHLWGAKVLQLMGTHLQR